MPPPPRGAGPPLRAERIEDQPCRLMPPPRRRIPTRRRPAATRCAAACSRRFPPRPSLGKRLPQLASACQCRPAARIRSVASRRCAPCPAPRPAPGAALPPPAADADADGGRRVRVSRRRWPCCPSASRRRPPRPAAAPRNSERSSRRTRAASTLASRPKGIPARSTRCGWTRQSASGRDRARPRGCPTWSRTLWRAARRSRSATRSWHARPTAISCSRPRIGGSWPPWRMAASWRRARAARWHRSFRPAARSSTWARMSGP